MMSTNVNPDQGVLIQNSLTSKAPAFATRPHWYMSGIEKKVKIGSKSFNYIDYLEAWGKQDCFTHRSYDALLDIRQKIQAAFDEIDSYGKPKKV